MGYSTRRFQVVHPLAQLIVFEPFPPDDATTFHLDHHAPVPDSSGHHTLLVS